MLTNKIGQTSHKLNKVTYRNSMTGWLWQRTQWLHSQKLTKNTHFLIWNLLPNYRDFCCEFAAIRLFWVQRGQKACDVKLSTPKLHWSTLTSKERRVVILNHQSIKVVVYNSQSVIAGWNERHARSREFLASNVKGITRAWIRVSTLPVLCECEFAYDARAKCIYMRV